LLGKTCPAYPPLKRKLLGRRDFVVWIILWRVDNGIDRAVDYLQFLQEFNQKDKKLGP
jgi:hypothetical protein